MVQRLRRGRQRGFTLIELLIVVAIIGIIAAILIPNLIDALQKAKQKRTVADMRNTGNAWMSWLTDQVSAAAAGQGTKEFKVSLYTEVLGYPDILAILRPTDSFFYMQEVPEKDGWKNDMVYQWTGNVLDVNVMMIGSAGRDGKTNQCCEATYTPGAFVATDYEQDLIWADGYFVRWPGGTGGGS